MWKVRFPDYFILYGTDRAKAAATQPVILIKLKLLNGFAIFRATCAVKDKKIREI